MSINVASSPGGSLSLKTDDHRAPASRLRYNWDCAQVGDVHEVDRGVEALADQIVARDDLLGRVRRAVDAGQVDEGDVADWRARSPASSRR